MSEHRHSWYEVSRPERLRALPVGDGDEGETGHWVLDTGDDVELLEPEEVKELTFESDYVGYRAELPVREIHDAMLGRSYDSWYGEETIDVVVVENPRLQTVFRLEFEEPVPLETFENVGILREKEE